MWSCQSRMYEALCGEPIPFQNPMICSRCEGKDNPPVPPLGTAANGYRDGFVQPADNFSEVVLKGDFGMAGVPICLGCRSKDQTNYIKKLQA